MGGLGHALGGGAGGGRPQKVEHLTSMMSAGKDPLQIHLEWCAPFFSGGGYSSEAISYVSEVSLTLSDLSVSELKVYVTYVRGYLLCL